MSIVTRIACSKGKGRQQSVPGDGLAYLKRLDASEFMLAGQVAQRINSHVPPDDEPSLEDDKLEESVIVLTGARDVAETPRR